MNSHESDVLKDKDPSKDLAWWSPNIDHKITPEVRRVLEEYSGIPSEDVVDHIYKIREKAWARRPWPCTGLGSFLSPMLPYLPVYSTILKTIKSGGTFLDVGCYCGTDLRQLVIDGCPQNNLYGLDLVNHWDIGFELFRDRGRFQAKFYEGDILNPNANMETLYGKVDIISATHFLHNWDWATQVKACCNISAFSKPGSMVVGHQVGTRNSENARWDKEDEKHKLILHTPNTFVKLWKEVGERTGASWKCEAEVKNWKELGHRPNETAYLGEGAGFLQFVVARVQ